MIANSSGKFCFATDNVVLSLFDHIEGVHPSYTPNQLLADKLAKLFFQLHKLPPQEFPYFSKENFDIAYAIDLEQWINYKVKIKDKTYASVMFSRLKENQTKLLRGLSLLQQWKRQFSKEKMHFVLTHGDPHNYTPS
ncbi:hypothetical protein [Legionella brunensis]|uniref:Aminoglycoside phosphotransferase domain-containing protein n=1 Tax=Legionella brunensis TaxID=29422 RepID=A0A0W0SP37_9GAMM|nr:hypothetical protein [Legionella brunensis]KTC85162.1 hypothetical protein Lbru_0958 [Legionella brunensis]